MDQMLGKKTYCLGGHICEEVFNKRIRLDRSEARLRKHGRLNSWPLLEAF